MARVFDLAPQLAVRKRTRAAFAKLHVRLGVQHAFSPQAPGVFGALTNLLAALQNDRLKTHLRQQQRRKNTARPKANDDRANSRISCRMGWRVVVEVRR